MKSRNILISLLLAGVVAFMIWRWWPSSMAEKPAAKSALTRETKTSTVETTTPSLASAPEPPRIVAPPPPPAPSRAEEPVTQKPPVNSTDIHLREDLPFHFAAGPANARDLIMAHMKLTVSRLDTGASRNLRINGQVYGAQLKAAAANDFATIEIRPPLVIYLLGLDRNLENAQLGGYCYFVENTGKLLGATDINYSAQSGGYQVGMSGLGLVSDHDKAIASALNNLAELDQVKSGSYEVRLLRLPFSFTGSNINMLIWLKSASGAADLFYTHERLPPPGFQTQTLYTADEFLARLHPPQAAQGAPASP